MIFREQNRALTYVLERNRDLCVWERDCQVHDHEHMERTLLLYYYYYWHGLIDHQLWYLQQMDTNRKSTIPREKQISIKIHQRNRTGGGRTPWEMGSRWCVYAAGGEQPILVNINALHAIIMEQRDGNLPYETGRTFINIPMPSARGYYWHV